MRYKNNGADDIENVVLVDQYPAQLEFVGTEFYSHVDTTTAYGYSILPYPS